MTEIYLGFWKNLSYLEMAERAAIVLALKSVLFFFGILLLLLFRRVLVSFFFLIINGVNEQISVHKSFEARADSSNRIARRYENILKKLDKMHIKRWMAMVFVILLIRYIALFSAITYYPQIIDTQEQTYIGSLISSITEKYQRYEAKKLQKAIDYQPLIPVDAQDVEESYASEEADMLSEEEIWLALSSKGKKGTNVKKKPSKKSKKVAFVSGKDQVLFLNRNKDGWVKVQLENGKKGWINQVFLKGVPD